MLDIKFIKYPMTFTTSPHIRLLVKNNGYEIIGRMMAFMEMLNEMDNQFMIDNEMDYESVKSILEFVDDEDFKSFLVAICKTSDFKCVDGVISSRIISDTMDEMTARSDKAKESVKKRWDKAKQKDTTVLRPYTTVLPSNTIREDKMIEEKTKQEKTTTDNTISEDTRQENNIPDLSAGETAAPFKKVSDAFSCKSVKSENNLIEIERNTWIKEQISNLDDPSPEAWKSIREAAFLKFPLKTA